jgi:hypothetical protein
VTQTSCILGGDGGPTHHASSVAMVATHIMHPHSEPGQPRSGRSGHGRPPPVPIHPRPVARQPAARNRFPRKPSRADGRLKLVAPRVFAGPWRIIRPAVRVRLLYLRYVMWTEVFKDDRIPPDPPILFHTGACTISLAPQRRDHRGLVLPAQPRRQRWLFVLRPLDRLHDQPLGLGSITPAQQLHPLARLQILVVLEEMLDLLQRNRR